MWNSSPESLNTKLHQISCKWSRRWLHGGIIALFGSWGLQATKLWNLWNLSHFTHTSLPTEGKRCNTSSVAGAYSGLAIAESFRIVSTLKRQKAVLCLNKFCLGICKSTSMFSRNVQATLVPSKRARYRRYRPSHLK